MADSSINYYQHDSQYLNWGPPSTVPTSITSFDQRDTMASSSHNYYQQNGQDLNWVAPPAPPSFFNNGFQYDPNSVPPQVSRTNIEEAIQTAAAAVQSAEAGPTFKCLWLGPSSTDPFGRPCNAAFDSEASLHDHVTRKHTKGSNVRREPKEFMCHWDGCGKHNTPETQFQNNTKLNRHLQSHTNRRSAGMQMIWS